jgi:hypothetical protein
MAGISDRAYTIACGRLAGVLGVSLASARRRVEIRAAQAGIRDGAGKLALAQELLDDLQSRAGDLQSRLTEQLGTVGRDDRFMVED